MIDLALMIREETRRGAGGLLATGGLIETALPLPFDVDPFDRYPEAFGRPG